MANFIHSNGNPPVDLDEIISTHIYHRASRSAIIFYTKKGHSFSWEFNDNDDNRTYTFLRELYVEKIYMRILGILNSINVENGI